MMLTIRKHLIIGFYDFVSASYSINTCPCSSETVKVGAQEPQYVQNVRVISSATIGRLSTEKHLWRPGPGILINSE